MPPQTDIHGMPLVCLPGALLEPSPATIDRLARTAGAGQSEPYARRVIVVTYPDAARMTDLVDEIAAQLVAAGVLRADVLGSSYGGWVAQCLVRRHPKLIRHLVLVHSFALRPSAAWRFRLGIKLWRVIPPGLFRRLLRLRVRRTLAPLAAASPAEYARVTALVEAAIREPATILAVARQNDCLLDSCSSFAVAARDLADHDGRVLIIESNDDPVIRAPDRARLRELYPHAEVRTFHGTGHVTALAVPEAFAEAVTGFLAGG